MTVNSSLWSQHIVLKSEKVKNGIFEGVNSGEKIATLKQCYALLVLHRGKDAWCCHADGVTPARETGELCILSNWVPNVYLWGPSVPTLDSTARALQKCCANSPNGGLHLDFKKNLKIDLSSIGKMYVVCAILHNALTCLYHNQTSDFFNLEPPTLNEYFTYTPFTPTLKPV